MKILLIGYQRFNGCMYPHLKTIIEKISHKVELNYFYFRERGIVPEWIINNPYNIKSYIKALRSIFYTITDILLLLLYRNKYDTIIAIDYYAYSFVGLLFKKEKVILWNYDIIGSDNRIYNIYFVRILINICAKMLKKHKKVIIQDKDRLNYFLESLRLNNMEIDSFYLPVVLENLKAMPRKRINTTRPVLLQCGVMFKDRGSDELLIHYQNNHKIYDLYFHGYLFSEIRKQIKKCSIKPLVSSNYIDYKSLPGIIVKSDIGFVCYKVNDINHYYNSMASCQAVEFIRMGVPVIIMGNINLKEFVKQENIGLGIEDISELNTAIEKVINEYELLSRNCIACFNKYFDSELYIDQLLSWI